MFVVLGASGKYRESGGRDIARAAEEGSRRVAPAAAARLLGKPIEVQQAPEQAMATALATTQEAANDFFPGYARAVTDVGRERG
jgi:hypothetical protein